MTGQHVGTISDAIQEDETRSAARAQQEALKRLAKPIERARGRGDYGDGDRCPIDPEHGKMFVLNVSQYCAHAGHDGTSGNGGKPRTRAFWPKGPDSFAAAVAEYHAAMKGAQ